MITLNNISKTYKSKSKIVTKALDNVSFSLPSKGLYFILGKSGSGKSTLLNIIGGLDKYDDGEIIIDGKNTKKFRNKDYDYYRNTYIGFIFQEFNLLEDYNVYDNIILSKKLQKSKVTTREVDSLLEIVGLNGLGKRRINELSGGQKQRVAIARSLIKNPQIILADEPTGSLDLETGKQIFELLKSISKEKLVIVVSHDRESANNYADGIIEIQDGKVIANSISNIIDENRQFKSIKSRLPILSSLKFAFLNLRTKKLKLIFTCLLVAMSLIFFGTSRVLSHFDIEKSYANTMVDTGEEYVNITKTIYNEYEKRWINDGMLHELTNDDISNIKKKLGTNTYNKYKLIEDNSYIGLELNYKDLFREKDRNAYFTYIPSEINFEYIEANETFLNKKILGKYPTEPDEILIHNYLADYIMKAGILLYNSSTSFKQEYYIPKSYEEIINPDNFYKLGSTKVRISGILLDDLSKYETLKTMKYEEIMSNQKESWLGLVSNNSLYSEMSARIKPTSVYVKEGFSSNINLKPSSKIDKSLYEGQVTYKDKKYYIDNEYSYLTGKMTIYNGSKDIVIEKLNDNETIVNVSFLDSLSDKNYSKLKEHYLKNYKDKEKKVLENNKLIQERNKKKLDEYNKKLESEEEVEEPVFEKEQDFSFKSDDEVIKEFITNYLKENPILNSSINLLFTKGNFNNENQTSKYDNIKIVGIQLEDTNTIYISNNIASDIMRNKFALSGLILKSNNKNELNQIFIDFPIDHSKYVSSTTYSSSIDGVSNLLEGLSSFCFYISIVFGIFAFILLTNFIVNSISLNKKVIGILRAMGARKVDVFNIFLNEGLLIGLLSLILSIITLRIGIYYMNRYISSFLFFDIDFITLTFDNLLLIVGSVLGIIIVSSLFTVRKIAKMKPVDAILNK